MINCKNCEHAIFDQLWGEYKCGKYDRTCTRSEVESGCEQWKEKKTDGVKPSTMADKL